MTNTTSNIFVTRRSGEYLNAGQTEDVFIYAVVRRIAAVVVTRATSYAPRPLETTQNNMCIDDAREHWNRYVVEGVWEPIPESKWPAWVSPIVEAIEI